MKSKFLKKLITGAVAFSFLFSLLPVSDVYAASGYKGLNGTEVIELPHTHKWEDDRGYYERYFFYIGNLKYECRQCINPVRYTDGNVKDCDELQCTRYNFNTKKTVEISEKTFYKVYKTYKKCIYNGGFQRWGTFKPTKLGYNAEDKIFGISVSHSSKGYLSSNRASSRKVTYNHAVGKLLYPLFFEYCSSSNMDPVNGLYYEIKVSKNKNMKNSFVLRAFHCSDKYNGETNKLKANSYYYVQVRPVIMYKLAEYNEKTNNVDVKSKKFRKTVGNWSSPVKLKVQAEKYY